MDTAWTIFLFIGIFITCFLIFVAFHEPHLFKISLRNIKRKKSYSALVIVGLLIGTAMISSSLTVKDSMEYLIKDSTYKNLGEVDTVVSSNQYFDYSLYQTLSNNSELKKLTDKIAPLILTQVPIKNLDSGLRESSISIVAFNKDFYSFGNFILEDSEIFTKELDKNDIIISIEGAKKLRAELGNSLEITFSNPSFSIESIFSKNEEESRLKSNFTVKHIVKNKELGRFHLGLEQVDNPIIFISLKKAQEILNIGNKLNTIVISNIDDKYEGVKKSSDVKSIVKKILDNEIGYKDVGLKIETIDYLRITSEQIFFPYSYYDLILKNKRDINGLNGISPILTYFVNSISTKEGKNVSYSTVTGFDAEMDESFGLFTLNPTKEYTKGELNQNEIIINNWIAELLNISKGDKIILTYMYMDRLFKIENLSSNFTVKYIVDIKGKANDKKLMPEFPGIENIDNCVDWEPPFPINLSMITNSDIKYWQDYRGTPKAYINLKKSSDLWENDFGNLTAIKLQAKNGTNNNDLKKNVEKFLDAKIGIKDIGISIETTKKDNLKAAEKMNILPAMFLGFGLFSIIAGIMLVVNIFVMLAEDRKFELGMVRAIGMTRHRLILMFLSEGMIYAIIASILGTIFGLLVGYGLIFELNNIWENSEQGQHILFHYEVESLLIAFSTGIIIAFITLFFISFFISRLKIVNAIRDITESKTISLQKIKILELLILIFSISLICFSQISQSLGISEKYMIQLVSPCILIFGISLILSVFLPKKITFSTAGLGIIFYNIWFCQSYFGKTNVPMMELYILSGLFLILGVFLIMSANFVELTNLINAIFIKFRFSSILKIATIYPTQKKIRTIMTIAMFSLVLFLIVSLSIIIEIQNKGLDRAVEDTGGGYEIIGKTSHSIFFDLNNPTVREKNNINSQILEKVEITQIKSVGNEGSTCSNLNPNLPPLILGVDDDFILQNRFQFRESRDNEWKDLKLDNEKIPIVVDYNTLKWLLGGDLGSIFTVVDDYGKTKELEVVGILENSIFSGTFIMSEQNIDKLYPKSAGYRFFLFEVKEQEDINKIAENLEIELDSFGMDTETVKENVENKIILEQSYTSLFQLFLCIGLIIGIAGLGVITVRSVIERRWEIGILRAIGFKRNAVLKLFIIENSYIALLGIFLGTVIGIISTYISFATFGGGYDFTVPIVSIIFIVGFVYVTSLLCTIFPAVRASRMNVSETLRRIE